MGAKRIWQTSFWAMVRRAIRPLKARKHTVAALRPRPAWSHQWCQSLWLCQCESSRRLPRTFTEPIISLFPSTKTCNSIVTIPNRSKVGWRSRSSKITLLKILRASCRSSWFGPSRNRARGWSRCEPLQPAGAHRPDPGPETHTPPMWGSNSKTLTDLSHMNRWNRQGQKAGNKVSWKVSMEWRNRETSQPRSWLPRFRGTTPPKRISQWSNCTNPRPSNPWGP